jgi:hypothetical protein
MRHIRCRDRFDQDEAVQVVDGVEQALAPAEQRWHQVNLHLVDQTGAQVLLRGPRTA